jgi:hypothetical protein
MSLVDEPEHEPWPKHKYESQNQNFNGHWKLDGDWVAKSTAIDMIGLKAWKKLDLTKIRTQDKINPHNEEHFTVFNLDDIKAQLKPKVKL